MNYGADPRSPRQGSGSVGSDPRERTRTKYEKQLFGAGPERENPLNIPLVLLEAVHSSIPDQLEVILGYIDGLPSDIHARFEDHFDPVYLAALRRIHSGLKKLRDNELPTEEELDSIAHPRSTFKIMKIGLGGVAVTGPISLELERFIKRNIVEPLTDVSNAFLPNPADGLVQWWFEKVQDDPEGPFSDHTPAGP